MKRILYLSLLLVLPFFLHADHGRNQLNGKWISPYFNKQIKIKVKKHEIKVKGINQRGWTYFFPIGRNKFEDCNGNSIRINNIHDLIYISHYRGERIKFVKKGHQSHNHSCSSSCAIGNDYFTFYDNFQDDGYFQNDVYYENNGYYSDWDYYGSNNGYRSRENRGNRIKNWDRNYYDNSFDGRYHVREIDEYVTLNRTRYGLKAKRGNSSWVDYTQNRNRKNEYIDKKGNKYLVRSNGDITWKSRKGDVSLNLKK